MIGLGLTACQKDEIPEAPSTNENPTSKASVYSFLPTEVTMIAWPEFGDGRKARVTLYENGSMVQGSLNGRVWLENMSGQTPITPYVEIEYLGSYWAEANLRFKPGAEIGFVTKGYLKFQHNWTGQVFTTVINVWPMQDAGLEPPLI